jgi:hypothetical protein
MSIQTSNEQHISSLFQELIRLLGENESFSSFFLAKCKDSKYFIYMGRLIGEMKIE